MRIHGVIGALILFGLVEAGPNEGDEPPELLVLQMDGGADVAVQVGKSFTATINGKPIRMKLSMLPHRVFDAGDIRFHYPRGFTFEYEKDADGATWTLSGPSTVLMLMRSAREDPKAVVKRMEDEMVKQFGPETKRSDAELVVGTDILAGRRLDFLYEGDTHLWQDHFAFDAGDATYLLMVQHTLTDEGTSNPETRAAIELLSKTLERRQPKLK